MSITTPGYLPVPRALEAAAVSMPVATLGVLPLVASEVRRSSQLAAPLASVRVHQLPNIYDTQGQKGHTVRRSLLSKVVVERRKIWILSSTMSPCQITDMKVWKMCGLAATDYTQSAETTPTTPITTTITTTPTRTTPPQDAPACETDIWMHTPIHRGRHRRPGHSAHAQEARLHMMAVSSPASCDSALGDRSRRLPPLQPWKCTTKLNLIDSSATLCTCLMLDPASYPQTHDTAYTLLDN